MLRRLWTLAVAPLRAHRGRPAALLALMVACTALALIEHTPLTLLQNAQFDRMQRLSPRDRSDMPALVVAIDEKSLAALGQWPWPRQTLARLIETIGAGEPLAIGLDMIFPEPDRLGAASLKHLYPQLDSIPLPDPDAALAAALAATPSVLGVAATHGLPPGSRPGFKTAPVITRGNPDTAPPASFAGALASLPALEAAARGQALLNAPADPALLDPERGILRRVPLMARVAGLPVASLGPEMLRVALNAPAVQADIHNGRITRVGVDEYTLPTQADGNLILHFGSFQPDRYLSAVDVLEGRIPPENFRQRFVLLGFDGTGLQDRVVTPLGEKVPGVDIHAQVLESLLSGAALTRPLWLRLAEGALLVSLGLGLIAAVPRLRPTLAVKLGLGSAILLLLIGYTAFHLGRLLFDSATLIALLNPIFFILIGNTLVEADQQRRLAEQALQASREAAARVAGELDAARRIQMGLLPDPTQGFAGETRFALAAHLEPAREVGGDYFDCFMLDPDHLCLAIGDVSGKGLPASLFMAMSKSVAGALLRQHPDNLAAAVAELDAALSRDNREMLFVTSFIAVVNVETGIMDYVCAGHDAPWLLRGQSVQRIPVAQTSGPPLCACEGFPYGHAQLTLEPGDRLLLTTDGVTEASNGHTWFGNDRLEKLLQEPLPAGTPAALVEKIRHAVRDFEAGAPPADDLTLLCLQWRGPETALPPPQTNAPA
ncbi:CHASE2 domain-containing protein [Azovibrio restrictus]|uniref:CHASE2 domain-containing protein n=1 Tax=Azovibrio restrictus TaxID=146938 RepID=UPI0026EE280F|nr:CHASE2 domain-containing protein [Azovibrio restrictus]